jgi:hypothetical protein
MAEPVTVGALVAWALSLGAEAIVKGALGEAAKDAYKALKTRVATWVAGDVGELEKTPTSNTRKAVIAEAVDQLSPEDQQALRDLAQTLTGKLREQAPTIGLDIGRLDALEVQLGNITVTHGTGVRIGQADVAGTFRTGDITVGPAPGKQ